MAMPAEAQAPIRAGETLIGPNTTSEASMCNGTLAFSSPSTKATRFSPSLLRAAPSVVT